MTVRQIKKAEAVNALLKRRGASSFLKAQIEIDLDVSKSMMHLFLTGVVQDFTDRIMAVATQLSDDRKLRVSSYGSKAYRHGKFAEPQLLGYIQRQFIPEAKKAGTWNADKSFPAIITEGASTFIAIKSFLSHWFGGRKPTFPTLHFLISAEGNIRDSQAFGRSMSKAGGHYFVLIGIGTKNLFGPMEKSAGHVENASFVHFDDLKISDDILYEKILTQDVMEWLTAFQPSSKICGFRLSEV